MSASAAPPIVPSQCDEGVERMMGTVPALVMVTALYAIPILVTVRPGVLDPDIWWHLRVGQWVAEHGTVPATDPFSRYGLEKSWVAYSWLFEVLVFRLHEWFGLAGIVAYRVVLSTAIVVMLHRLLRRCESRFLVATGLTAVAAVALAPMFSERPWLFTILFAILTLEAILDLRARRSSRLVWFLPLLYALWANLHIQFVYGLLLLGLACVAPVLDTLRSHWHEKDRGPEFPWRLGVLTILCALATLVNPYHVRVYGVVLEYAAQPGPFSCVTELRTAEFREVPDWVMLLLGACAVFALGRRRRLRCFEVLLLACTSVFAFRSRRDYWFLVLAAVAILANGEGRTIAAASARFVFTRRRWAVVASALAASIVLAAWARNVSTESMRGKVADAFPVKAAEVVAVRGYDGPLYNDFNWGGFLIWQLPRLPVLLDGRTNLHGDERILRIGNTWAAGPGWRDDPDLAAAGVIVADTQSPLACVLVLDDRFRLVYEDAVARVFVRGGQDR